MTDEQPLGGFIGIEATGPICSPWPGILLSSGRSCVSVIAEKLGAKTFHVPFLICDSVLSPIRQAGMEVRFYRVDEQARPVVSDIPDDGAPVLALNQFGVRPDDENRLVEAFGPRVVLDRTHDLNAPVPEGHWSFCSIRKWFGVADGAWLQGPKPLTAPSERNTRYALDHLLLSACGREGEALEAYRYNNSLMDVIPMRPSLVSERQLEHVDREGAKRSRITNFNRLHELLGPTNRLEIEPTTTGPICYPYRPCVEIPLSSVHSAGIYAPCYWPEVLRRDDPDKRFAAERSLAKEVIPLPVDQRYGPRDMQTMVDRLHGLLSKFLPPT